MSFCVTGPSARMGPVLQRPKGRFFLAREWLVALPAVVAGFQTRTSKHCRHFPDAQTDQEEILTHECHCHGLSACKPTDSPPAQETNDTSKQEQAEEAHARPH